MKIATLQFAPKLGQVNENIAHADAILSSSSTSLHDIHLLVLPELAFTGNVPFPTSSSSKNSLWSTHTELTTTTITGYNHPSLESITPYLEPTAVGPSTRWAILTARRLQCLVTVGYPELFSHEPPPRSTLKPTMLDIGPAEDYYTLTAYNSTVTVNPRGEIVAHYRKTNLYYTDEVWAQESPEGFTTSVLRFGDRKSGRQISAAGVDGENGEEEGQEEEETIHTTTHAICMDLNHHHFIPPSPTPPPSPPSKLCQHILNTRTTLLVLSTAWLTHLPSSALHSQPRDFDQDTLGYWFHALEPVINNIHGREVICVFANRCGEEPGRIMPAVGSKLGEDEGEGEGVRYAGSSWIGKIGVGRGEVVVGGIMGRAEEGVLVVETEGLGVGGNGLRFQLRERDGDGGGAG
ncbi:MAG: hypothetical protein Q9172_003387 [Xanthocarpia lactea]